MTSVPPYAGTLALCTLLLCQFAACSSGDRPDPSFDTKVSGPAYSRDGPSVLFDEAHHNMHRAGGKYRPFVKLIESDGYRVIRGKAEFTAEDLEGFSLLVIANACGRNERNDDPAFTDEECDVVRDWVSRGGALLLITDHYPMGHAAERLAHRFGIRMTKGVVEDSLYYDASFDNTHILFTRENGGLAAHPILEGRDPSEKIRRVLSFTGQAVDADPPAVGFLALSGSAVGRPPLPQVERRGTDVIVNVAYGDPEPARGMSQGLALALDGGRVVVMGEAAMLTAQLHRYNGRPIGMNVAGYDNRQLALNIVHWLTEILG